ncbi:MAG TPA: efflux RND transporter periplasmic adaptor subunit, partial [Candidatus Paceibacterota bacterium]|nr:efflux RND transporter periplasmic adaptor subunit [Candidatus Paceibacterota bacterium]
MSSSQSPLDDLRIERKAEKPSQSKTWLIVAGAVILILIGAAVWWHSQAAVIEVQTAVARDAVSGGDRTVLNASGYVTARREATVSSKVTGKVTEVLIEEGMKVTNGQVLARLDDSNIKTSLDVAVAQLASAKAALAETEAQLTDANLEFKRETELAKQHIASQSDLDLAEANAKELQAHLAQQKLDIVTAERQVESWQQQMDDMIIRAPFDGVITTKDAQPGEMISPISAGGGFTRTGI